jgi:hypothetical protein
MSPPIQINKSCNHDVIVVSVYLAIRIVVGDRCAGGNVCGEYSITSANCVQETIDELPERLSLLVYVN